MTLPLRGRRILVTRSREQASVLAAELERLGAEPILVPTIEITPPASWDTLDRALAELPRFDWIVLTSANAASAVGARLDRVGATLPQVRGEGCIAAIGSATAQALRRLGVEPDLVPPQAVAESLAEALGRRLDESGVGQKRVLLINAEQARDHLRMALCTRADVGLTVAPAYANCIPESARAMLQQLFGEGGYAPDGVTFTSSSTALNLGALLHSLDLDLAPDTVRASIGPITSATLRDLGLAPHVEAAEATIGSLADALAAFFDERDRLVRAPGLIR